MELTGAGFALRETSVGDAQLLLMWHADPEVNRYWDRRPLTYEEVAAKYLGARAPEVRCFIIQGEKREPIGFIEYAYLEPAGDVGLDMFLIPNSRGRGLGPKVASFLAQHLLTTGAAQRVTVDPLLSNQRAIRAWNKAGFRERSPIDQGDHGEPAILMEFGRS
jgi:aminoglycoside 6'-N-acetyltransferase